MKILITGNMGYIGPTLIRRLRVSYPEAILTGADVGYFANCLTNAEVLPETRMDIQYFQDIRHPSANLLEGVDVVVHLAAISNDPMGNKFEDVTDDINYRSSMAFAQMAKAAGVRSFVFASSCSMYGFAADEARSEQSPLNPLTAYSRSKVAMERYLESLASPAFRVTCLRFATACGMSERLRLDLVLNDFVAGAVANKKIVILSDGTPWRPLITVHDMAIAIDWAISRDVVNGGDFLAVNTGSNEWNCQVRDLAEAVVQVMPGVEISINKNAEPDKRSYRVSFDLYRRLAPNHQPEMTLVGAIQQLKEGLEAMGFADQDFRNSKLMRLKMLSHLKEAGLLTSNLEWVR
ncbi:MAG: SDR family oxidoreductase [Sulfuricella sp.]|nr:SDR family oxidoreductase [Sulfuricella sp.]